MTRLFFAALALSLLSACGGGGGGGALPIAPAVQAPPPPAVALIEVYSDSTGLGFNASGRTWPESISIPGYTVSNLSKSSIAAFHVLPGSAAFSVKPWQERMQASQAVVVLIALGLNDTLHTDAQTFRVTLKTMAQIAQGFGKLVVLQTPNPTNIVGVAAYIDAIRNVAADLRIPLIDQYAHLGPWVAAMTTDGVHPTAAVYDTMGQFTQAKLLEILK